MHTFLGVKKRIHAASRSGLCKELEVWKQPVTNHLYFCALMGKSSGPLIASMWLSLLNHVTNKHDGHDGPYSECLHEPLGDRPWLAKGTFINLALVQHSLVDLMWEKNTFCKVVPTGA